MTTPSGGGNSGGGINLATLWIPVMPEVSKIGSALREAGEQGRRSFEEGFSSGGSGSSSIFDQMTSQLGSKITQEVSAGLQRGLAGMELPGGLSRVTEGLMRGFEGVTAHTEKAERALHDYERAHTQLTAALEREAVAQARLDDLHAKGAQGGQLASGLASLEAAHRRVAQAADADTEAHETMQKTMEAGSSKMLTFAASTGVVSGAISAGIMLAAEAITKTVEAGVEGFEKIIETAGELAEKLVETGEQFEELHRSIELATVASGSSLEELKIHADALAGSLDTGFDKVGNTMAVLSSRLDMEAGPALDRLTKHVEELRDRFGSLDTSALAGAFNQFEISGDHADQALASLVHTAREYGVSLNTLVNDLATAGPALQEFDLSLEQGAHLLAELESRHINAAAAVNALTRAEKGAAAQHVELKDFLAQELAIIEKYRDSNNKAAAEQEALLAFGTKNWMAATTSARAYLETVAAGPGAFKASKDETDHLIASTQSLENRWTQLRNSMTTSFAPVASLALEGINAAVSKLGAWIQAHEGEVLDFVKRLGTDFINAIPAVQEFVAKSLEAIEPWAKMLQWAVGTATRVFGELIGVVSQLDKLPMFKHLFGDFSKELKDAADMLAHTGNEIRDFNLVGTLDGWSNSIKGLRPDIQGWTKDLDESTDALKKQLDALNNSKSAMGDGEGAAPGDIGHVAPPAKSFEPGGGSGGDPDPDVGGADPGGADSSGGDQPADGDTPEVVPRSWTPKPPPNDGVGGPQHVRMAGWHPRVENVDQYSETGGGAPKNPGERHTGGGHHGDAHGGHHAPQRVGTTPEQDRSHRRRVEDLGDKVSDDDENITDLTQKQSEASGKVQHDKALRDTYAEGSLAWAAENKELIKDQKEYARVTKELTRTMRDRTRAEEDTADENAKYSDEQKAKHGGKGGEGSSPAGDFGKQFLGGLASDLGLGGIFGKSPLEWGLPKLAEGILGAVTGGDSDGASSNSSSSGGSSSGGGGGGGLPNISPFIFGDKGVAPGPTQGIPHLPTGTPSAPGPAQGIPHLGTPSAPGPASGAPAAPAAPGNAQHPAPPAAPPNDTIVPGAPTPTPVPTPHFSGQPGTHYTGFDGGGGGATPGGLSQGGWHAALNAALGGGGGGGAAQATGAFTPAAGGGQGAHLAGFGGGGRPEVAKYIYAAARSRGYSDGDSRNIVAYSVGESGLNPGISGGVQKGVGDKGGAADEVQGLFQEKPGFAQAGGVDPNLRGTVDGNVTAYLNNLDKHRNDPGDIDDHLLATSSGGPMYTGGRQAMSGLLDQVQGLLGDNPDVSGYLNNGANGAPAPGIPASMTPGGFSGGASGQEPMQQRWMAAIQRGAIGANGELAPGTASGSEQGLQQNTIRGRRLLSALFPELQTIGGVRNDPLKWHPQGLALDLMIPGQGGNNDPTTPQGLALGDQVNSFINQNAAALGSDYTMWQVPDHHNHVHGNFAASGYPTDPNEKYFVPQGLMPGGGGAQVAPAGFRNAGNVSGGPTPPAIGDVPDVNAITGQPHYTGPSFPGPAQSSVSNGENVSPQANFAKQTGQNLASGVGGVLSSLAGNPDLNARNWAGILHTPEQQSAQHSGGASVQHITQHFDHSIDMSGSTVADPKAMQQQMQEQMNSRYYSAAGGLPMSGIGSP